MSPATDITRMLSEVDEGQPGALDVLMEAVYQDLNRVALKHMTDRMGAGLPGATLEPAALVNESFMKLIRQRKKYDNRAHFFAIATKIMLRVLTDYQRARAAQKRGGDQRKVTLDLNGPADQGQASRTATLIEVDTLTAALEKLESLDPRKADVVKLRVIWGLKMDEIAASLEISVATVERDWTFAKAWLGREAAQPDETLAEEENSATPT